MYIHIHEHVKNKNIVMLFYIYKTRNFAEENIK